MGEIPKIRKWKVICRESWFQNLVEHLTREKGLEVGFGELWKNVSWFGAISFGIPTDI